MKRCLVSEERKLRREPQACYRKSCIGPMRGHRDGPHLFHRAQLLPFPLFLGSNFSPPNRCLNFSACPGAAKQ